MPSEPGSPSSKEPARRGPARRIPQELIQKLAAIFDRHGYMRRPDVKRRKRTPRKYKKGYEIRLLTGSLEELGTIRRLLTKCDIKVGNAFLKGTQWCQPIYGRERVRGLLNLVGADPGTFPMPTAAPAKPGQPS